MGDWEIKEETAQRLLCLTFPDIFKKENEYLCVANGIEALNIVAYGNAGLVDIENRRIFRVGEPQISCSPLEEYTAKVWVPLVFPSIVEKSEEIGISSVIEEKDIPFVFNPSVSFSTDYAKIILSQLPAIDAKYIIVWDRNLGEYFWKYFASLVLRSAGIITGHAGLTFADLHGYYLPDFNPPVEFSYQWSIFMFHITSLLSSSKYFVYGERSEYIKTFSNKVNTLFKNQPVGIVIEAESSAYRARTYSKNSGIGQLKEKYLSFDYQIGYVTGPGVDEISILPEERVNIGAISSDFEGKPILINPTPTVTESQKTISTDAHDFILKLITSICRLSE